MFCPKCKGILMPKKDGAKSVMTCMKCGYKEKKDDKKAQEPDENKNRFQEEEEGFHIDIVDKEYETDPVTKAECPKCHNNDAYFWEVQTRAADEPPTKFHKCTKCKHTWRDYS